MFVTIFRYLRRSFYGMIKWTVNMDKYHLSFLSTSLTETRSKSERYWDIIEFQIFFLLFMPIFWGSKTIRQTREPNKTKLGHTATNWVDCDNNAKLGYIKVTESFSKFWLVERTVKRLESFFGRKREVKDRRAFLCAKIILSLFSSSAGFWCSALYSSSKLGSFYLRFETKFFTIWMPNRVLNLSSSGMLGVPYVLRCPETGLFTTSCHLTSRLSSWK